MRNSANRRAIMVFFGAALLLVLVGTGPNPPAPRAPRKSSRSPRQYMIPCHSCSMAREIIITL